MLTTLQLETLILALFSFFQGVLHFQVETEGLSWSYIFGHLERSRTALNIVDYSVSQTTLEQVNTGSISIRWYPVAHACHL